MVPFEDHAYSEYMKNTVQPWLAEHIERGYFRSKDGTALNYYKAVRNHPRGCIVMVHGFCEFFGKYHEMIYNFYEAGYSVYFPEQRGHGFSGREVPEKDHVFVDDFREYVRDLRTFMKKIVMRDDPDSVKLLFAHSMGGAIAALFLEQCPEYFSAAVLSSPMLRMNSMTMSHFRQHVLYAVSRTMGWRSQILNRDGGFDGKDRFAKSGARSRARYEYTLNQRRETPEYQTSEATYAWARAAIRATDSVLLHAQNVKIPVLICQAGYDTYVDNSGQDAFAGKCKTARVVVFPKAKHEIYTAPPATLARYYRTILSFYEKRTLIQENGQAEDGRRSVRPIASSWERFAECHTTAEFSHLGSGYNRHCGPTAVTNLFAAWQNRYVETSRRISAQNVFETVAELGERSMIYRNVDEKHLFGGTSDLLYPVYLRLAARKLGLTHVRVSARFILREEILLRLLRSGGIAYVQLFHHPKYGFHHVVIYGAELVRDENGRRHVEFLCADGWSSKAVRIAGKDLGMGTCIAIHHT